MGVALASCSPSCRSGLLDPGESQMDPKSGTRPRANSKAQAAPCFMPPLIRAPNLPPGSQYFAERDFHFRTSRCSILKSPSELVTIIRALSRPAIIVRSLTDYSQNGFWIFGPSWAVLRMSYAQDAVPHVSGTLAGRSHLVPVQKVRPLGPIFPD